MRLKLKHLRHPLHTISLLKTVAEMRRNMRRVAALGERLYRNDPRYRLDSVTDGLESRIDELNDDSALLERICASYSRAVRDEASAPRAYRATSWWEQRRLDGLQAVTQALTSCDLTALRLLYRDFLRNSCSAGLIGTPFSMSNPRYGHGGEDLYRRFALSDVLHRIDHWKAKTDGRFELRTLAGPSTGNPFGVVVEGTLIGAGAEYHHHCAHRVLDLLDAPACEHSVVAEIGGGFGAMAWYLLRDRPGTTYFNFDVPESIALASYYLLKSLPHLRFLLYGEGDLTSQAAASCDVVLMPSFIMGSLPKESANITFCSHVFSNISDEMLATYLADIERMTQTCFLFVAEAAAARKIADTFKQRHFVLRLTESISSSWHNHRARHWDEIECLYRINQAGTSSAPDVEEAECRS